MKFQRLRKTEVYSDSKERKLFISANKRVGRNDLCSCGSGKKYKKCRINK